MSYVVSHYVATILLCCFEGLLPLLLLDNELNVGTLHLTVRLSRVDALPT